MRGRRAGGAVAGLAGAALVLAWLAGQLWLGARETAVGMVGLSALSAGAGQAQPAVREVFCRRGWHRARRHGRVVCVRDRAAAGGLVLAAAPCPATGECPPVCQRVKFTNSAGTAWVTALLCDVPRSGPVVCVADGQNTSRPQPGSVYLCRER